MIIKIERGIPLMGYIAFGIIDRGTNLLQVRPTSVCNLNCPFCSVDSGIHSKKHKVNYEVDCDYLIDEIEKIISIKGDVEINLDSVGEVFCYNKIDELIRGLRKLKNVKKISLQTNGMYDKVVYVDVINISLHAIDKILAKRLAGVDCYNVEKVLDLVKKYRKKNISVRLCPVWIPGVNDSEIPKIINFARENKCDLGIQKYEVYSYSRQMTGVKPLTWWKFYEQLRKWEKEFGVKLKLTAKDVNVVRGKRIEEVFKKGEKVQLKIVCKGWFEGQMIGVGRNRCVSIENCNKNVGDLVNVKILEVKNNIYLAK